MRAIWPQIRAALLLLHLVAVGLSAVPAPEGGLSRSAWKDPTVQGELKAWAENLRALGLSVSADEFEDGLWGFATAYMKGRKQVLAPFKPYYRYCGTTQAWRMFVAPHRYPARLFVEVSEREEGDDWRLVYEQDTPGADWMKDTFEDDRFRSIIFRYSWKAYRRSYKQMGDWVADRAAEDLPGVRRVRLRWYKYRTPSPQEVLRSRIPEGEFVYPLVIEVPVEGSDQVERGP